MIKQTQSANNMIESYQGAKNWATCGCKQTSSYSTNKMSLLSHPLSTIDW
jgi:hypothetical protein